jgi:hypothetical protein
MKNVMAAIAAMGLFMSCQKSIEQQDVSEQVQSNSQAERLMSKKGPLGRPQCLADCESFEGVATPATFKPESDPFDELYVNPAGFMYGSACISESKPGDRDYNGGRWHVNMLKASVDGSKYATSCRVEDLDPNDFMSTDVYFECPLLPRKK